MSGLRKITFEELRQHDGKCKETIYVALAGKVYDVTEKGAKYYKPGGPYDVFAGKNVSRALACMNMLKAKDGPDDLSDLSEIQKAGLARWVDQFNERYPVVGELAT